jgi:hypothetical protein
VNEIEKDPFQQSCFNWKVMKKRMLSRAKQLRPGRPFTRVDKRLREQDAYFDRVINKAIDDLVKEQRSVGKTIKE